jgi:prepilin-type N-terminal cleavage/methylation domain-containing protein
MNRLRPRPGGFPLVEVLVVIAIVTVLVAVLMPACRHVGHAARIECAIHWKQIGWLNPWNRFAVWAGNTHNFDLCCGLWTVSLVVAGGAAWLARRS